MRKTHSNNVQAIHSGKKIYILYTDSPCGNIEKLATLLVWLLLSGFIVPLRCVECNHVIVGIIRAVYV